jgi:hypothetical protein
VLASTLLHARCGCAVEIFVKGDSTASGHHLLPFSKFVAYAIDYGQTPCVNSLMRGPTASSINKHLKFITILQLTEEQAKYARRQLTITKLYKSELGSSLS